VRTPTTATLGEGFLQLVGPANAIYDESLTLEAALLANESLAGGARFALDARGFCLHVRTDVVMLEEALLLDRVRSALAGIGHGSSALGSGDHRDHATTTQTAGAVEVNLGELLRESSWPCTERGADEFAVELDAVSAPPARVRRDENGIAITVELIRSSAMAEVSQRALAIFLLTAGSALRMVRAHATGADDLRSLGFQVSLAPSAVAEEIDHALAALSIAHRMCAREANVLLDKAAARCYLGARDLPTNHNHEQHKENRDGTSSNLT
jgi:hypothetical protein